MPFPNGEQMRQAIEIAIHEGLDHGGDWIAVLPNGQDIEFRPAGEFEVLESLSEDELEDLPADQPAEMLYRFRVRVELVRVEPANEDE